MSHTTEMKTSYLVAHEEELVAALAEHFGDVEVFDKPQKMKLYDGTQSNWTGDARLANIIIRRKTQERALGHEALVNDLGFLRDEESGRYSMLIDDGGFPKKAQDKVAQNYAAQVSAKQLRKQGYTVKVTQNTNGTTKVLASRYA